MDALLFRAGPGADGALELQLVVAVLVTAEVLRWQPGAAEDGLADALEMLRSLLQAMDPARPPVWQDSYRCERLGADVTVLVQPVHADAALGIVLRGGTPVVGGHVPGTLLASLDPTACPDAARHRLISLSPAGRRLVQAMATLGGQIPFDRLMTLVDSPDELTRSLQQALDAGLVRWQARSETAAVDEPLRTLIRAEMTPTEHHAAHAWAQRWSHGADLLLHRAAATWSPSAALADALEREANLLGAKGHPAQAARLLRYAAGLSSDAASATHRQLRSVEFRIRAFHTAAARDQLDSLRRQPPSAYHLVLSGRLNVLEGRLRKGLVELAEAHERATAGEHGTDVSHAEVRVAATLWLAQARWLAGHPSQRIRPLLDEYASSPSSDPFWVGLHDWLLTVLTAREEGPATALNGTGTQSSLIRPPSPDRRRDLLTEAWLCLEAGELQRSKEAVHRALEGIATPAPAASANLLAHVLLSHLYWLQGDWSLAQLYARMAIRSTPDLWHPLATPIDQLIAATRGEMPGTVEWPAGVSQQPALCDWAAQFAWMVWAVETGDAQQATRALAASQRCSDLSASPSPIPTWRDLEVLRAAALSGDDDMVRRARTSLRRLRERSATPWTRMFASWGEGLAAAHAGRREDALDHYRDAENRAAHLRDDAPWYRARLQADHAQLLACTGKHRAAQGRYRTAHEVAARLGAQPLIDRCAEGLAGLHLPRSLKAYGLTERESAVTRLVASGLTNKEAAARLYITPAAITFHLGNIYTKVGVHDRYELRAWWHSLDER